MNYYVRVGEQNVGPYSVEELLARGLVRADSYVWTEGMNDWQPARTVPAFARHLPAGSGMSSPGPGAVNPYSYEVSAGPTAAGGMQPELPHSGFGITSTILGVLSILGFVAMCITAVALVADDPDLPEDSPEAMFLGTLVCGSGLLAMLGVLFGIIGVVTPGRKKLYAFVGLGISGLIAFCGISLLVIGLLAE